MIRLDSGPYLGPGLSQRQIPVPVITISISNYVKHNSQINGGVPSKDAVLIGFKLYSTIMSKIPHNTYCILKHHFEYVKKKIGFDCHQTW